MADNPLRRAHQEWMGNVRPEGLLVSLPALELAQAAVDRNPTVVHRALLDLLPRDRQNEPIPTLPGFLQFAERVLGWPMDLYGAPPESLHTFLETYSTGAATLPEWFRPERAALPRERRAT